MEKIDRNAQSTRKLTQLFDLKLTASGLLNLFIGCVSWGIYLFIWYLWSISDWSGAQAAGAGFGTLCYIAYSGFFCLIILILGILEILWHGIRLKRITILGFLSCFFSSSYLVWIAVTSHIYPLDLLEGFKLFF